MENCISQLQQNLLDLYKRNNQNNSSKFFIENKREKAINYFKTKGFPTTQQEHWKNTDLIKILKPNYEYNNDLIPDKNIDINKIFQCEIRNWNTLFFANYNGYNLFQKNPLTYFDNGIIAGSIKQAQKECSQLLQKYNVKSDISEYNGLTAINSALYEDGLFIYIPENVKCQSPMQLVNIVNHKNPLFLQTRNIIILEKNSELTFLHCDDSLEDINSFKNSVTQIFIGENALMNHYKLQNKHISSVLLNTTFIDIESHGTLNSIIITFNCGTIRNEFIVNLNGEKALANVSGLCLIDKTQHIDNQLFIKHFAPCCKSIQTFKGILDDNAYSVFSGNIYVDKKSYKTEAYQINKNILLTDKAKVISKPFLEIYNDDVICQHGSTTGQLDSEAMFYMRQRGICEKNSKLLLMHAFADEVVKKIKLEPLLQQTQNMVNKRLRGELFACSQCILHCKPDNFSKFGTEKPCI